MQKGCGKGKERVQGGISICRGEMINRRQERAMRLVEEKVLQPRANIGSLQERGEKHNRQET